MAMEIRTTNAQIGINRTPGVQSIKQPKAELDIKTTHAQVSVELTLPKIEIDQSQSFAESGLKSVFELTKEVASYARSKMQESIGRIASQGTELTNIHQNPDAIATQSINNAYDQFLTDYNMVTMPRTRPQITVIEGNLDIQVDEGKAENNTKTNKPELEFKRGKVETYLKQKNSISMRYLGENTDMQV